MLSGMRSFAKSKWAGLLLFLLIVALGAGVFYTNPFSGFSGGGFFSAGSRTVGARDVNRNLTQYVQRYREETGEAITEREAAQQGAANQVLNNLAQRTLVLAYADKMGIEASPSAVSDQIATAPTFKDALGRLDTAAVERFAQSMGLRGIPELETAWREDLTLGYIEQAVPAGLEPPALLSRPLTAYFGERRTLSFARLGPESVPALQPPTEQELTAFYDKRRTAFEQPERRSFSVLTHSPEDYLGRVELTDQEVRAEYDRRIQDFSAPETREIVQFSADTQSTVQAVVDLLKQGVQIADAIARTEGVASSELTVKPGDIEDETLAQAAFGLPQGESFGPIPVEGRYYGVYVRSVTPGEAQPFEAVEEAVRQQLLEREAQRMFAASEETFYDLVDSGLPLEQVANELNAPVISLAPVDRSGRLESGQPVPLLASQSDALSQLFDGDAVGRTQSIEGDGVRTILRLDSIIPARTPEFSEVRADVEQLYGRTKQQEAAEKVIADAVAAVVQGEDFDTAVNKAKLIGVHPPQPFMRANPDALDPGVMAAAFEAAEGETVVARSAQGEPWIVKVEKVEPTDPAMAAQMQEQVAEQVEQSLRADLGQVFMQAVQQAVKLKTNQDAIEAYLKSFQDEPQQ